MVKAVRGGDTRSYYLKMAHSLINLCKRAQDAPGAFVPCFANALEGRIPLGK
jgi:hypothetical protein